MSYVISAQKLLNNYFSTKLCRVHLKKFELLLRTNYLIFKKFFFLSKSQKANLNFDIMHLHRAIHTRDMKEKM